MAIKKYINLLFPVIASLMLGVFSQYAYSNDIATVESLVSAGELGEALEIAETLLEQDQFNVNLRFIKGLILTRQNKLQEASDVFLDLTNNHPELPEPYNNLAVVYAAMGDFTRARLSLEKAIKTHPSYATAHENMGDIYAKMASRAYNNALELDTGNETAREKLSLVDGLFSIKADDQIAIISERRQQLLETENTLAMLNKELESLSLRNQQQERRAIELQSELDSLEMQKQKQLTQTRQAQEQTLTAISEAEQRLNDTREEIQALEQKRASLDQEIQLTSSREIVIPDNNAEIISSIQTWAGYWSNKNVAGYISSYSGDFIPPGGMNRQQWTEQRQIRIQKPKYIQVRVEDFNINRMGSEHAQVKFTQYYQSDTFSDQVVKTMLMKYENGEWLIVEERT